MKISHLLSHLNFFENKTSYKIVKSKKFNKMKVKYSNKRSNIKLLDSLVKTLSTDGEITSNNVHTINQPIRSEHLGKDIDGWKVAWISKTDDLRLAYNRSDDVIEVKFGKASDIGYKH